jgi:hypothetical protein
MGKGSNPVKLSQLTGRGQIGYTVRQNWRVALTAEQPDEDGQQASD